MSIRLGTLGTYVHTQHDDFDDVVGQGAIPIIHDQDITIAEARLSLDVGLTRHFAASLVVPVRVVSTTIDYLDATGKVVELVEPSTHHRDETLTGIADPTLIGSVTHAWGALRITGRAGLSIPLGRTEKDPFAMPDLPHEHIQFGTGTVNPIVAADATYAWDQWRFGGYVFTQQTVYENAKGYQAGDRYAAGIGLRRALGRWSVRGGLEMQAESYERWNGDRHNDEGNQGRIDAMVAGGASWGATDNLSVDVQVKIPFVTHVVGGQLDMPALLELGATWTFGAGGAGGHVHEHDHHDEDEHGHEHGREHAPVDTSGADVLDLGHGGEAVDLVPVPGKITIFDFWAPWCEPCKTLEPALVELAKRDPAHVALRRIDVVDWESAVVERYLTPRGFDLPHVKIYDAKGALVFEQSSGTGKLVAMIEEIRRIVAPGAAAPASGASSTSAPAATIVEITAGEHGFAPARVEVTHGTPVTLRFRRTTEDTCATEVAFDHDGKHELVALPLNTPVDLTVTFDATGTITYACAMNMFTGEIVVR